MKSKTEAGLYAGYNKRLRMDRLGALLHDLMIEAAKARDETERDYITKAASSMGAAVAYIKVASK
jgi:hypothetical protein